MANVTCGDPEGIRRASAAHRWCVLPPLSILHRQLSHFLQAFVKAWKSVCYGNEDEPTLVIPEGKTFMLQPIIFQGPCIPTTINIKLQGTVIAPKKHDGWKWQSDDDDKNSWIKFSDINGPVINGGGQLDGQGASWWDCKKCNRPTAMTALPLMTVPLSSMCLLFTVDLAMESVLEALERMEPMKQHKRYK
ncbi:hypothetical protein PIB30_013187 [Stylosanthes scabra]|uniref:Uncharacterized protein n=1 Tax=Stylosanthes scabra TaxID=79078 RepID=A0ABU6Z2X9_9FABA|nr:hypothetical protein [Stylosanthes scabra]